MPDEEHAESSSGRDINSISAGNVTVTSGMAAIGTNITQVDLLKIAACRVSRGPTPQELQLYGIDPNQVGFDFSKRVCPAPISWEQK